MSGITLTEVANSTIPTPASGKATLFQSTDEGGPAYKDDAGTVTPLQGADGADGALTYLDHGNTGSTETVDVQAYNIQRLVADAATVTLTLSNAPASGTPCVVRLWLEQDGSGGRDWAFPAAVTFGDAGEPDWTTRSGGEVDIVDLMTVDGGTVYVASLAGRVGATGAAGAVGGAIAIPYVFSTTTTDSDPGSGNLRLDNATQSSATKIRADLLDANGATMTTVLDSLDDSSNTVKGHIRLFLTSDPTKFLLFTVASVDSSSGYRNITVACIASSTSSPFSASDAITLAFTRAGDAGSAASNIIVDIATPVVLTGGSITLNGTNWEETAAETGGPGTGTLDLDMTGLAAGDIVHVGASLYLNNAAVYAYFAFATIVSSSPVNWIGAHTSASAGDGMQGLAGITGREETKGDSTMYVVQSGDLSAGALKLRLYHRTGTATNRTLFGTAANPLRLWAIAYRP